MSYDALSEHASPAERRALMKAHRTPLLMIGIVCGYLGAAPGVVWASFALFAVAFALLIPVAIWIYTLVFAFSSLWFSHYCLAALEKLRTEQAASLAAATTACRARPWRCCRVHAAAQYRLRRLRIFPAPRARP